MRRVWECRECTSRPRFSCCFLLAQISSVSSVSLPMILVFSSDIMAHSAGEVQGLKEERNCSPAGKKSDC